MCRNIKIKISTVVSSRKYVYWRSVKGGNPFTFSYSILDFYIFPMPNSQHTNILRNSVQYISWEIFILKRGITMKEKGRKEREWEKQGRKEGGFKGKMDGKKESVYHGEEEK